jgi:Ca2+-binding RTX toxin-like protein
VRRYIVLALLAAPFLLAPASAGAATIQCSGGYGCNGTDSADYIKGTSGFDFVDARGGNDQIEGFAGSDTLQGGSGADDIFGGVGRNVMDGGWGNDRLIAPNTCEPQDFYGGPGTDEVWYVGGGIGNNFYSIEIKHRQAVC